MGKIKNFLSFLKSKIISLWNRFRRLSRKKKVAIILVLLIVLALLIRTVGGVSKDSGYTLVKAEMGSIEEVVSESGNINSSNRTDIYSPTNGVVTKVLVSNGDIVVNNQILFEVKSTATQQEKSSAEANYLAAVSALNSAIANRDSLQSNMFSYWQTFKDTSTSTEYENDDGTPKYEERSESEFHIAEKNWLSAEKNYKNAQTQIAQAQANVSSLKLLLDATKDSSVKATTNGVVENISVGVGSAVVINQMLAPVKPIMSLVSDAPVEVVIDLGESDIGKVKPGEKVLMDVSAIDNKEYKGEVLRVDSLGTDEAGVIKYSVYIVIENPDDKLRPGMSVDVEIITKELDNILIVPNSAIKPYQGGRAVRVPGENDEIEFIPVKIGVRGKSNTQILSGVEEGQEVISALSNDSIKRPSLF